MYPNVYHNEWILFLSPLYIPGGRSLRPVRNKVGSFINGADQNFSPIFHWAINSPLTRSPKGKENCTRFQLQIWGKKHALTIECMGATEIARVDIVAPSKMQGWTCLLYTSPSPRDRQKSRMPSSA